MLRKTIPKPLNFVQLTVALSAWRCYARLRCDALLNISLFALELRLRAKREQREQERINMHFDEKMIVTSCRVRPAWRNLTREIFLKHEF